MSKTFIEYAELLNQETGIDVLKTDLKNIVFDPDHGFVKFSVDGGLLLLELLSGDASYWVNWALTYCKANNLAAFKGGCSRNIYAYIRLLNSPILEDTTINNTHYIRCSTNNNRLILITQNNLGNETTWVVMFFLNILATTTIADFLPIYQRLAKRRFYNG